MMRILVVGAEGTVGKAAVSELGRRHEIIKAGRNSGEVRVDVSDEASIHAMFAAFAQCRRNTLRSVRLLHVGAIPP